MKKGETYKDNLLGIDLDALHKKQKISSFINFVIISIFIMLLIFTGAHFLIPKSKKNHVATILNEPSVSSLNKTSSKDSNNSEHSTDNSLQETITNSEKIVADYNKLAQQYSNSHNSSYKPNPAPTYNSSLSTSSSGTSTNTGYNTVSNSLPSKTNIAPDCTAYSSQIQQLNSNLLKATAKLNADSQAFSTPGGYYTGGQSAAQAAAYEQNILNQDQQAVYNANTAINRIKCYTG